MNWTEEFEKIFNLYSTRNLGKGKVGVVKVKVKVNFTLEQAAP